MKKYNLNLTEFEVSIFNLRILIVHVLLIVSIATTYAQNDLNQKLMMGYQGWFLCKGDNSAPNEWRHWFQSLSDPSAVQLNVDMWPDMSEYTTTYATSMNYPNGTNARLFSSHDVSTTNTHFKWMQDYNIYGVYLQRFLGEAANDPRFFQVRNNVLQNVISASQTYNRHFSIMYDISGVPDDGTLYNKLVSDWEFLVNTYNVTNRPGYVKQNGLPVLAIWGIGFRNRGLRPETFQQLINYFHNTAAPQYRAYIVGGVPDSWRTLNNDSESDPRWTDIYHSLDMISPWAVGRYGDVSGADNWKTNKIIPDMNDCNANGVDYMPVIFPGFSWFNMHDGAQGYPLNQIPRAGGNFYWRQAYNAISAGSKFVYVAMFDEVDEGTAMFKVAATNATAPAGASFVTMDEDGQSLPSDWYLRLANETQKMLDGTTPLTPTIPIVPNNIPVTGVTVTPNSATIVAGSTTQLTANLSPSNATNKNVTWSSNNASIATVNANGLVTGVAIGTAIITVTTQEGNFTATSNITVTSGGTLPSPWVTADVGAVAATGSANHSSGTFTVIGSGADIWDATDEFRYVYQPITGDIIITARVASITNTNAWAKAGVMIRESTAANARHAMMVVTPGNGISFQNRITAGGTSASVTTAGITAPYWVRVTRVGNTFTGFASSNGTSWTQIGTITIAMASQVQVGLAVTSHNDGVLCTASFTNVSLTTPIAAPVISSASTASGTVGSSFNYTITASNNPTSYGATNLPPGLSVNTTTGVISGTPTTGGTYSPTISATNGGGTGSKIIAITINNTSQSAYPNGTPWAIPGTIEVENFDNGGEGVAYHDNDAINSGGQGRAGEGVDTEICSEGGLNIGWTNTGEWYEYTVNVMAGTYNIEVRTASIFAGGTFHIEFNGVDKTGLFTTTNTGAWQTWTTVSKSGISLTGGVQVMRIYLDNANFNLNSVTFTSIIIIDPSITVSPTSASVNRGSAIQLTANTQPSTTVTWNSSNTAVATVNQNGLVTGVALGTATIIATRNDNGMTATSAITVISTTDPVGVITCYRAPGAITVNGQLTETGWNVTRAFSKTTVGSPNNTATFGVLWDNTSLYIGSRILDANLFSDSSDPWEDDAIEVYIDANNNKLTSYDGRDNQIIKNYNKSTVFTKLAITGLQHAWATISGGYSIEFAIPWSQLGITAPAQGTTIGFDVGYNDDDNGGVRNGQAVWNGTSTNYQNTSAFGSLVLNNANSSTARLAVESENEEGAIFYWPTMVDRDLTIETDGSYHAVEVFDMMGRSHHRDETIKEKTSIVLDLGHLVSGVHFIRLEAVEKSKTVRVMKK